jgi:hypothetical protein
MQFKVAQFLTSQKMNKMFEVLSVIFLAEIKTQWGEGDGRILLGDNTGGGVVMLRSIRFQCDRVCISTRLPSVYEYTVDHVCAVPMYAKFDLRRTFPKVSIAEVRSGCALHLLSLSLTRLI